MSAPGPTRSRQAGDGGFELVLVEHDDRQAIYETWMGLSEPRHGFHRYELATGACTRIDVDRATSCDLSVANKIAAVIRRAVEEQGGLPERIERPGW